MQTTVIHAASADKLKTALDAFIAGQGPGLVIHHVFSPFKGHFIVVYTP
jgi:hypothetical protein